MIKKIIVFWAHLAEYPHRREDFGKTRIRAEEIPRKGRKVTEGGNLTTVNQNISNLKFEISKEADAKAQGESIQKKNVENYSVTGVKSAYAGE